MNMEITELLEKLSSKEKIVSFLSNEKIYNPEGLINFYTVLGKSLPSWVKRKITRIFLEEYPLTYTKDDIRIARLNNSVLKEQNKENVIKNFHNKVMETKEFASNSNRIISEDEIFLFKKLYSTGVKGIQIAKEMKRTYSTIEYLCKKYRKGEI